MRYSDRFLRKAQRSFARKIDVGSIASNLRVCERGQVVLTDDVFDEQFRRFFSLLKVDADVVSSQSKSPVLR